MYILQNCYTDLTRLFPIAVTFVKRVRVDEESFFFFIRGKGSAVLLRRAICISKQQVVSF